MLLFCVKGRVARQELLVVEPDRANRYRVAPQIDLRKIPVVWKGIPHRFASRYFRNRHYSPWSRRASNENEILIHGEGVPEDLQICSRRWHLAVQNGSPFVLLGSVNGADVNELGCNFVLKAKNSQQTIHAAELERR